MKLILLGPPGAGKGTQAELISKKLNIPHISTGDILRESIRNNTSLGEQAKKIMDQGNLVSDEIILGIIKERVSLRDCKDGALFDGFKTIGQVDGLKKLNIDINLVIEIRLSEETIFQECLEDEYTTLWKKLSHKI